MSPTDGLARSVPLAREAIRIGVTSPDPLRGIAEAFRGADLPKAFDEPRGVFVTLHQPPGGALRGCVGFPRPVYPLRSALPRAAWSAASEDPRFPAVTAEELPRLSIEVSVLTVPERLPSGPALIDRIVPGRDGLMVSEGEESGLLLPQVATEFGWGSARFLAETCRKAGLRPGAWKEATTIVERFRALRYWERSPGGEVVEERVGAPEERTTEA